MAATKAVNRNPDIHPASELAPVLYRVQDACALLSVSRAHLYSLVGRGELRLVKLGNRTLIPASEIARLAGVGAEAN